MRTPTAEPSIIPALTPALQAAAGHFLPIMRMTMQLVHPDDREYEIANELPDQMPEGGPEFTDEWFEALAREIARQWDVADKRAARDPKAFQVAMLRDFFGEGR